MKKLQNRGGVLSKATLESWEKERVKKPKEENICMVCNVYGIERKAVSKKISEQELKNAQAEFKKYKYYGKDVFLEFDNEKLKELIKKSNKSMPIIATEMGISYWVLYNHSRGKDIPCKDTVLLYANYFNVDMSYFKREVIEKNVRKNGQRNIDVYGDDLGDKISLIEVMNSNDNALKRICEEYHISRYHGCKNDFAAFTKWLLDEYKLVCYKISKNEEGYLNMAKEGSVSSIGRDEQGRIYRTNGNNKVRDIFLAKESFHFIKCNEELSIDAILENCEVIDND